MKILRIIMIIVISILLLLSFVLVGSPIKYNCLELNVAIICIGTIYGIYKIVFKKEKIINNKIDWLVLIFYLTPLIPLIFKTYGSLEETLKAIVRNVSLFNLYCMLKEFIQMDKKNSDYLTNILIFGGVILALFGVDELLSKEVFRYMKFIGLPNIWNHENRMFSTLGYANTFATIMATGIILCYEKLKKHKTVYSGLIYLFLLALLLSYSRSVIAIFAIVFAAYILLSKRKRIYIIYTFFVNIVLALLGMKIFETLSADKKYILAWLSIVFFTDLSVVIAEVIRKCYKKICKIKLKTYIWIVTILVICVVLIYVIGLQLTIPLELFETGSDNKEVRYKINKADSSKLYTFELDIEAMVEEDSKNNYTIEIAEENKYYDLVESHIIKLDNFVGKKEISFTTTEETVAMVIYFKSNSKTLQKGFVINSLHVNGKEIGLNYLYLPMRLVERIDSVSISNKSLWERFVFHKDGLKIIKDNLLFGTGARGWLHHYAKAQSYVYSSTEVHSYPLQLWLENGIVAFVCYIIIMIYVVLSIIKRKKTTGIEIAFILVNLHAAVDFDMSFYVMMVIWVVMFSQLSSSFKQIKELSKTNEENNKKLSWKNKLQILIIVMNISAGCLGIGTYKLSEYTTSANKEIQSLIRKDKFDEGIELMKKIGKFSNNYNSISSTLEMIDYECVNDENLEHIYKMILNSEIIINPSYNMAKNRIIDKIIKHSTNEDIVTKLAKLVIGENEEMILNIKNKDANRLSDDEIEMYLREQEKIYESAYEILNK